MSASASRYRWLNHRTELPLLLLVLIIVLWAGATGFLEGSAPTAHLTVVQAIRIADQPNRVNAEGSMVLLGATPRYNTWSFNGSNRPATIWVVSFKGVFTRMRRITPWRYCEPVCVSGLLCPLPQPFATSGAPIVQPVICPNIREWQYNKVTIYINDANGRWLRTKFSGLTKFTLPPAAGAPARPLPSGVTRTGVVQ